VLLGRGKQVKVLVLLIAVFVLSTVKGHACSCVKPDASEALVHAQAVFVGEVIDVSDPRSILPEAPASERLFKITFKVERAWKGAPFSGEVGVLSAQGNGDCAHPPVSLGEKYLIYAEPADGWPMISSCSRTALLTDPVTPVEWLAASTAAHDSPRKSPDFLALRSDVSSAPSWECLGGLKEKMAPDLQLLESLLFPEYALLRAIKKPASKPRLLRFLEPFEGIGKY
jgi:hypothetical protein